MLVNARLSEASWRRSHRLAWLARPAYRSLTAVWAQTPADAARFAELGAKVQGVFGNLKFDATPNADQLATGRAWRSGAGRPVLMLASSREGEEEALLHLLSSFRPAAPVDKEQHAIDSVASRVQWLIVPRHPQRFDAVATLIGTYGFTVSRRSNWGERLPVGAGAGSDADADVIWLGDSLGEMALYYGLADVALLGGSFAPLGGQNLIEAAACACPVVMGPHTFNFSEAAELAQAAGAALRAPSLQQAVETAQTLANDLASRAAMAHAAAAFSGAHRGAVEKTAAALLALLDQQGVDAQ
jgi:3-deoxy-D-manno-octulosonic-acid transferase